MKILHLRSSGGLLGAENVIIEICKHAGENGCETVIGAIKNISDPYPEFLNVAKKLSLEIIVFPCRGQFDLKCAELIKKYITENNIDILHTHGYKEDFYAILSNVKIPKIATNHLWKKNSLKDRLYCFMDSFFLKRFDKVIGVSEEIVEELKSNKIHNSLKIDNGIDVKKYSLTTKNSRITDELSLPQSDLLIGMISSITPEKNHKTAIMAFSKVLKQNKNIRLLIVGDGSELPALKNMCNDFHLTNNVIFAGKRTDIPDILSVIDIFLITSLTEGLPMAMLEAMAAGKAIIATTVGEIPNVIQDNVNGFLIKPNDIEETAQKISSLISAGKSYQQELGEKAFITVKEKYSSETMAKNYFSMYKSIINS